jgi:hypothetical protein
MKFSIVPFAVAFLTVSSLFAQNLSRTGVASIKVRNTGAVLQHGEVKGYYYFYNLEKKDRKTNNYLLSVSDENLREVNSVTITRPSNYQLIESSYNGSAFLFLFFDPRSKNTEMISYDNQLKQIGQKFQVIPNQTMYNVFQSVALGNSAQQRYLVPLENRGFIRYGSGSIEYYNDSLRLEWSSRSKSKEADVPSEGFQSREYIGSVVAAVSGKSISYSLLVNKVETGELIFQAPMISNEYSISPSDISYDSANQRIVVFGEYFNKDDKQLKAQSLGFCYYVLDVQGNPIDTKTLPWSYISMKAPVNESGKFDGVNTNILFHDFIRTADGQIFAIGEQYKKAASAAGIGLQAFSILAAAATGYYSGGSSSVQMNIYNMVVFQFSADYSLEKVHIFEKNKSEMLLPSGSMYMSSKLLSYYVKAIGGFDFRFSQEFPGHETFAVIYVDADRGSQKAILGSIVYTPEKVFTEDKMRFDRRSQEFAVMRAKPGYVLIAEYFKKEKKFDMRLEKINY